MKYERIKGIKEKEFRRLTGIKRKTFEKILEILKKADKAKRVKVEGKVSFRWKI